MFEKIAIDQTYSRPALAKLWGYSSFHAIARGVVTPKNTNKIILFVTETKQAHQEQYNDCLSNGELHWEGPTDHFAENRMIESANGKDEIHLFYRDKHHRDFSYLGQIYCVTHEIFIDKPSVFTFMISSKG